MFIYHLVAERGPGWIGVDLFFVLSGFLITGICVDYTGPGFARAFYGRRALRILPAYFAVTIAASIVTVATTGTWPVGLGWIETFTTNIALARAPQWVAITLPFRQLWSVAVEEQFYLVWPLLLAITPTARRVAVVVAALPIAFLVRVPLAPMGARVTMLARMDTLATGALIALLVRSAKWPEARRVFARAGDGPIVWWLLAASCGSAIVWWIDGTRDHTPNLLYSAIAIGCGVLVAAVVAASPSATLNRALRATWLRRVGARSYAVYLIHGHVIEGLRGRVPWFAFVALSLALTWALALLSWAYIEAPVLRLKSFFPYPRVAA